MNTHDGTQPDLDAGAEPADHVTEQAPKDTDQLMQAASGRIAELEVELGEMRDRWMRSEAEMQNVRARAKRDADDARQYAVQSFAKDVVEAAENLKRGLDSIPPPSEGEAEIIGRPREGFEGVERSFIALLERHGIKRVDPTGALFDPNLHQAMGEQETGEHPPGTVVQAWTAAWTLHGRLLRPALVVVAKAPSATQGSPQKLDTTA